MKQHVVLEAFLVPVAERFLDQPLDFVIQPLDRAVGQPMREEGEDVVEVPLAQPRNLLHRLEPTPNRPRIPLIKMTLSHRPIGAEPEVAKDLLERPSPGGLEVDFLS